MDSGLPVGETNHINYTTWQDKGGNIGVQCDWCKTTHWSKETKNGNILIDPAHPQAGEKECPNCQAIKTLDLIGVENKKHSQEEENDLCDHKPTQP